MDGQLMPHLELGHHPFRKDETYDENLGELARKNKGDEHWNHRVREAIARIDALFFFDHLYIGGGNARTGGPRRAGRDARAHHDRRQQRRHPRRHQAVGRFVNPTRTESPLSWDPISEQYKDDPHAVWRRLRDEAPVYYNPTLDFYALSRFVDVDAAHRDPENVQLGPWHRARAHGPGRHRRHDDLHGSPRSHPPPPLGVQGLHATPDARARGRDQGALRQPARPLRRQRDL